METKPGRRPFYKYASPESVLAMLSTGTARYSTPLLFNDPFDVQGGLHFDFDLSSLHRRVVDRIAALASAPEEPSVDPENVWGKVVLEMRRYFPKHGFDKERWMALTKPSFAHLEAVIRDTQQKYREHWRNVILPSMRVFCVSEERDNLLMWAHYCCNHKGAVLELWSLPEEDNPLSVAVPVQYAEDPIPFYTESEWLDDFVGIKGLDFRSLYRRYACTKSSHWSYEKEWRVWYPLSETDKYDYSPIRTSELTAVYLGCQAKPDLRTKVKQLLSEKYPATKVFVARKSEERYALEYMDA